MGLPVSSFLISTIVIKKRLLESSYMIYDDHNIEVWCPLMSFSMPRRGPQVIHIYRIGSPWYNEDTKYQHGNHLIC